MNQSLVLNHEKKICGETGINAIITITLFPLIQKLGKHQKFKLLHQDKSSDLVIQPFFKL